MKKGTIIFGVLIAFILTAVQPGLAQRYYRQGMWPDTGMNLTEEQLAKIQELRLEFQQAILPMQSQIQTQYMKMRGMYYQNTKQEDADAVYANIEKLEMELDQKFHAHQQQIRNILTNEQKVLFDQWGGLGFGAGLGYGAGFGRGWRGNPGRGQGWGMGMGRGGAWNRGYGRGMGPGRGMAWDKGPGMGMYQGRGTGWNSMGRGFWCPRFQQRRYYNRPYNWRRY